MNIVAKAEVHFHEQERLSIYLESNCSDEFEKVGEIGLLVMFALRNLSNLGKSEEADKLGLILSQAEDFVVPCAIENATMGFALIPYPGYDGRKRFYSTFHFSDERLRLDMKPKGFGILGTALGYYAPIAVLGLFRYLAVKRVADEDYLRRLAGAAAVCGRAQMRQEIGLTNQLQLAGSCITACCGELLYPEIRRESSSPGDMVHGISQTDTRRKKKDETMREVDSLPDTIVPSDDKYDRLGSEFTSKLGRSDGANVAKTLHAHFEQDLRDWFYDGVWRHFSTIPVEEWSQNDSITAEFNCRGVVSFMQSVRGSAAATERGYISNDKSEWYTNWLLRLNLGESDAKQAEENWLPGFKDQTRESQLGLFSAALSKNLPEIQGQFFLLHVYAPTLDLRVQATTARAFGDLPEAQNLRTEAVALEENVSTAIEQYSNGGGICYILENDQGVLITQSEQYGTLFHVWTHEEYADEINEQKYSDTHQVSSMVYRELDGQLQQMQSAGVRYVTLDRRMNGDGRLVPIHTLAEHVKKAIIAVESSELGTALRRGLKR